MNWGRLLCRLGWHDRRVVTWTESGTVRRGSDQPSTPYEYKLSGYRCVRCEPAANITNDPIVLPSAQDQAGGVEHGQSAD